MRQGICVVALLAIVGCTSTSEDTTTTSTPAGGETTTSTAGPGADTTIPPPAVPAGEGCDVVVSGDVSASWEGPSGPEAFVTDHWWDEAELRALYEELAIQGDPTFDELQEDGLPVLSFFLLSCVGPEGDMVSIAVSEATTITDLPMQPGEHLISGGEHPVGHAPPAEFVASYQSADGIWGQVGIGSLHIEGWDGAEVRGTFTFVAEEWFVEPFREIQISGGFRFSCQGSDTCG